MKPGEHNYHAQDYLSKYYAHELSKRCSSDSLEKLAGALMDAQVDLNPHQVIVCLAKLTTQIDDLGYA